MAKDVRKKKPGEQPNKKKAAGDELLAAVPAFDPQELKETQEGRKRGASAVPSPLGPPQKATPQPVAPLLPAELSAPQTAVPPANLQAELKEERDARLQLERQLAALEVEIKQLREKGQALDTAQQRVLELERELASLRVRATRTEELAAQLAEERQARVTLERERATLEVQVEGLQKLDQFLAEERQARMNAQSRAANAEARLARLEGELAKKQEKESGGFFSRLFGR